MLKARVSWFQLGASAAALPVVALLMGSPPASAQSNPPVTVYHSLDSQGADPRADSPVGCAGGSVITNGDFEFENLGGWQVISRPSSSGSFYAAFGGTPPFVTPISGSPSAGPEAGSYYAVSDQNGDATHVLAQEFYVPPGAQQVVVSFDMFVNNWGDGTVMDEAGLEHRIEGTNQFASVDLVTGSGFAADPFTRLPADIVRGFYSGADQPLPDETPHPYTSYSFDISDNVSAGGSYVLRFAETNNTGPLNVGVDNVDVTSPWGNCVIRGGSNEQLELWIYGGAFAGGVEEDLCNLAENGSTGDQLCGADIIFVLEGMGEFTSFEGDPALDTLVSQPVCTPTEGGCYLPGGTKLLRMNFTRGASTPAAVARRLGVLTLDSTGATPELETAVKAYGAAAGAKLQLRPIAEPANPEMIASSQAIAVPEPALLLQLLCGVVGLRLLERRRR